MSDKLILDNIVAYSLQIGMLVGLAAFVPALLRLRMPGAKLVYWHILLAACLLAPWAAPRKQDIVAGTVQFTSTVTAVQPAAAASRWTMPPPAELALIVLAGGVLIRLGWLAVGFWRLRRYRLHSAALDPAPSWSVEADVRISEDVSSPVTFGWRKPVILLPAQFPDLDPRMQETILCHEVLHVRRRDWLFTLAEELVRALFWFHPAIWWLLGEIALAREQAVDREVIEVTKTREEYVDALLAIAGANPQLDLAPAPLFLRKRHLKQRVVSILKEVRMSKTRLISALAAGLGILAVACWFTTGTFPLSAAPQADAQGVTIDMRGSSVLHRAAVDYPEAALRAGVQGTVVVEVKLNSSGEVADARVLSGPEQLRSAALQSVLKWHFTAEAANSVRQVGITFALPEGQQTAPRKKGGVAGGAPGGIVGGVPAGTPGTNSFQGRTYLFQKPLGRIDIVGLPPANRDELMAQLPVHVGDILTPGLIQKLQEVVHEYDEHLHLGLASGPDSATVRISTPEAGWFQQLSAPRGAMNGGGATDYRAPDAASTEQKIRVGGNVQQSKLLSHEIPVYPPLAKQARIQGAVHLEATIGPDGHITELHALSGHPLLAPAAIDAVKNWVYEPTMLNGKPVTVVTQIDVNFTLADGGPPAEPQQ